MPLHSLAIFFLGALGAGGLVWVFVYPILSGERHVERRQASVVRSEPATRAQAAARAGVKTRREQLETTLKEFEERRKKTKNPPLSVRISQAGLSLSPRQFMMISAVLGVVALGAGLGADLGVFGRRDELCGRPRPSPLAAGVPQEASGEAVLGVVSRCGRRHRARHQGRASGG